MNVDEQDRFPFLAPEIDWIRQAIAAQTQSMALSQIAEAAMAALRSLDVMAAEARAEALSAGVLAARRIAGAALARYPLDVIETTIAHCVAQAAQEPRITVRVGVGAAEALKARIEALAEDIGFAGRFIVTVDPAISGGDCRLEWSGGGVERDSGAIADRIEAELQRFIDADRRRVEDAVGA